MFGVTFGTRNAAALLGTLLGGVIADNHGGDSGSALCFGAYLRPAWARVRPGPSVGWDAPIASAAPLVQS